MLLYIREHIDNTKPLRMVVLIFVLHILCDMNGYGEILAHQYISNDTAVGLFQKDIETEVVENHDKTTSGFSRFFNTLTAIDTMYITPQAYNFTLMLQNSNTYESYTLRNELKQSIRFAPRPSMKLGAYIGWRWLFVGYAVDISRLSGKSKKSEFDISLYTPILGIDIYSRSTGNNYTIRSLDLGNTIDTKQIKRIPFSGFKARIKGFNAYYIFNHSHFSYPAAFSQSTIQRRSCGSIIAGIGYCEQKLSIDQGELYSTLSKYISSNDLPVLSDSAFDIGNVKYTDWSIMGGYAYNWVFAKQWLFSSSYAVALGYKHSVSDMNRRTFTFKDFSFRNVSLDGIARFGLVWNNMKWYAGSSLIIHTYTYRKSRFSINNAFGTLNIYAGWNFMRKKPRKLITL